MDTHWNHLIHSISLCRAIRASIFSWGWRIFAILIILGLMSSGSSAALVNVKISGNLPGYSNVDEKWTLSPNGQYVVFITDKDTDNKYELYSVSLDGSSPVKISGTLAADADVNDFLITKDNAHVVFTTTSLGSLLNTQLFSTPIAGGENPTPLNGTLPASGYINGFQASNDGQHVAYDVKSPSDVEALYTTAIHGGEPALIQLIVKNEWSDVEQYAFSPDSTKIVYVYADGSTGPTMSTISFQPIEGGSETEMGFAYEIDFLISPDSLGVAYMGRPGTSDDRLFFKYFEDSDLPSIPYIVSSLDPDVSFAITPNSQTIVYTDLEQGMELYAISRDGGSPVNLSGPNTAGGNVTSFQITTTSEYVVYLADQQYDEAFELFGVPIDGSTGHFLISQLPEVNRDVIGYAISPNGLSVVYIADQAPAGNDKYELYAWTNGMTTKLNDVIIPNGDVTDFAISNNSMGVVYLADQELDECFELYAWVWGERLKLNLTLADYRDVKEFVIAPNNQAVIYRADQEVLGKNELYMTVESFGHNIYLPMVTNE